MRSLTIPAIALLLSGCATFNQRELAHMQASGVPSPLLAKLDRGVPLTPPEIVTLTRRNVPDEFILRHLDYNGVNYLLTKQDIEHLRGSGVSARVIDALLEECEQFARQYAAPTVAYDSGLWWVGSPHYGPGLYYDPWW